MFEGFSQEAVDFLWDLRFNNQRDWFRPRRDTYMRLVDAPLRELAVQTEIAMAEAYPKLELDLKVARVYRDARRLYNGGPYRDTLWFSLRKLRESEGSTPCFYFEIAPDFYGIGMGCYDPTPTTMAKLRTRIDRDPKPMERLARKLAKQSEFVLMGQEYKRPKGDPGELLAPWYNRRQLTIAAERECGDLLFTPELGRQVLVGFRFLMPFYQYLREVVEDPSPR